MRKYVFLLCIGLIVSAQALIADVRLLQIISNGMVLQRHQPIAVWGWADPGEQVKVSLNKQQKETTDDSKGKWKLALSPEEAGGPFQLVVAGKSTLKLSDVLIGEVWICSGQSNMEWSVANSDNAEQEIARADSPRIRHIKIPRKTAGQPLDDIGEPLEWKQANPQNVGDFT